MQHYCEGGVYTETTYPEAIKCPGNMTTRGMRSSSSRACGRCTQLVWEQRVWLGREA
jgi:hypothetical protein